MRQRPATATPKEQVNAGNDKENAADGNQQIQVRGIGVLPQLPLNSAVISVAKGRAAASPGPFEAASPP